MRPPSPHWPASASRSTRASCRRHGPERVGQVDPLNVAGGLDRPTSGTVSIGGDTLTDLGPRDLAKLRRRRMGFVFQDYNLIPSLTAAENVAPPLESTAPVPGRPAVRPGAPST